MNDIYLIGEVGWEITLQTVIDAVEASDRNEPLTIHIHSHGGAVYDGLAIYNYLKGLEQEVHTKSSGLVASIASIIFLAGKKDTRSINSTDNFLIHLPSGGSWGNAEDLEKSAEELRKIEQKLADIYASETDLTSDEAKELMKEDKFLETDFLQEKGFVNEIIEFKAVASFKKQKMAKDEKQPLTKEGAEGLLSQFFNKYFGKKQPQNKIVQDATGTEIDFTDLEEEDTPSVGDKAMVDGENASGDYVMPNGETYVFTDGELTEIKESDDDEEDETMDSLKAENEQLKDELATSAQNIENQEKEIKNLKDSIEEMKNDFTTLKNSITGSFDYDESDTRGGGKTKGNKSRRLYKD